MEENKIIWDFFQLCFCYSLNFRFLVLYFICVAFSDRWMCRFSPNLVLSGQSIWQVGAAEQRVLALFLVFDGIAVQGRPVRPENDVDDGGKEKDCGRDQEVGRRESLQGLIINLKSLMGVNIWGKYLLQSPEKLTITLLTSKACR